MSRTARAATTATVLLVVLCSSPREARAQYLFVPFVGGAFAGNTTHLDLDQGAGSTQLLLGGSVGWLSAGILGFEGDFAYAPGFFERENPLGPSIVGSNVVTLSGSVIVAVPLAVTGYALRPYVVGGVGLVHSGIEYLVTPVSSNVDDNSPGFNVGGGAIGFFTARTGVRFELRHFRTFEREAGLSGEVLPRLSFWRFTVGVVVRR